MANNYRPGYERYAPQFGSTTMTDNSYRSGYGLYTTMYPDLHPRMPPRPTIYPVLHPSMPPSTHHHPAHYPLPCTDRPTVISHNPDEYHLDLPHRDRGQPPDYDSVFQPSKMIKTEEQGIPVARHRETVLEVLDGTDDETYLYHKRPRPDTTTQRNEDVLSRSKALGSRFGRLSESDIAEPMDQSPLCLDRPTLMPSAPSSTSKRRGATSQGIKITDQTTRKAFRQARGQLQTCRSWMQGSRKSLASRYENDPMMKGALVYEKLKEIDEYFRQVEDGLAGAEELIQEFIRA